MTRTRYREERTLVRRVCRRQGESRGEFKAGVAVLRKHFRDFNLNASEICQWLIALRPKGKHGSKATKPFWKFFLEPKEFLGIEDDDEPDRYRRMVFDVVIGKERESTLSDIPIPEDLVKSIRAVAALPKSETTKSLFGRMLLLEQGHRLVLLKASAEWVVARYLRGYENYEKNYERWKKDKKRWEGRHPELTIEKRERLNAIFKEIGIEIKNPRMCKWRKLRNRRHKCRYGGKGDKKPQEGPSPLCIKYCESLIGRTDLQNAEEIYRVWRAKFLRAPRKPAFRYPSARILPMPKIFGRDFFRLDFENSEVKVRLENMEAGEWLTLGIAPWKEYDKRPEDVKISSVQVSFVGTRARVGFRFRVPHEKQRFNVSQDEIDLLRRQEYPDKTQDKDFLREARKRLLGSFTGESRDQIKVMAVDLGTSHAAYAVFEGERFHHADMLDVVKIDKLYPDRPKKKVDDEEGKIVSQPIFRDVKGVNECHVGRHLEFRAAIASRIAKERAKKEKGKTRQGEAQRHANPEEPEDDATNMAALRDHDMLGLSVHVRWMIRDWVRVNAKQIIDIAKENKADLIVFESMRGRKVPGYDVLENNNKRRMGFFAYGRIRRKVTEKAVEQGMRVVTVPDFMSSQYCGKCKKRRKDRKRWKENKDKGVFICESCGHKENSDINAARILGQVFWDENILPDWPEDDA